MAARRRSPQPLPPGWPRWAARAGDVSVTRPARAACCTTFFSFSQSTTEGPPTYLRVPSPAASQADLQGALAGRESELALARQQLAQLTADFKFNLKLLEERDLELERLEGVLGGLREAAAAKELVRRAAA